MSRAVLLVAAAALVATASALDCPAYTSGSLSVGSCVSASGNAAAPAAIPILYTPSDSANGARVYIWNIDDDQSFTNNEPTLDGQPITNTGFDGISANDYDSGLVSVSNSARWGWEIVFEAEAAAVGTRTVEFDSADANFAIYVAAGDEHSTDIADISVGESVSVETGMHGHQHRLRIVADFVANGYMVKSISVKAPSTVDVSLGGELTFANRIVGGSSDDVDVPVGTTVFEHVQLPNWAADQADNGLIILTEPDVFDTLVDWSNGPLTTVSVTLEAIEDWPTLSSEWVTNVVPSAEAQYFHVPHGLYWSRFAVETALYTADGAADAGATESYTSLVQVADNIEGDGRHESGFTASQVLENSNFHVNGSPQNAVRVLAPASNPFDARFVVKVQKAAEGDYTAPAINLRAVVDELDGECPTGYSACNALADDHVAAKAAVSSNDDGSRLRHCLLVPDTDDLQKLTTRCGECVADCDCGPSQYCHMDIGVCPAGPDGYFLCNSDSYRRFGVCIDRDPGSSIFGSACRAAEGSTVSQGEDFAPLYSRAYEVPLAAESAAKAIEVEGGITGNAFCGAATYYNSTPPAGIVDGDEEVAGPAGIARNILWEGTCVNHVCHECANGATSCDGHYMCIQGRWQPRIIVDNTARTFNVNSLAGVGLATCLMVVILQLCVCARMVQAHNIANPKAPLAGAKPASSL